MARNHDRDRGSKRIVKDNRIRGKKKVCIFCKDQVSWVDYKDANLLKRFMSDRGKIRSRRVTGNCAQHQREVQVAIKTAREVAFLPYTQRTVSERGPRNRFDGGDRPAANGALGDGAVGTAEVLEQERDKEEETTSELQQVEA